MQRKRRLVSRPNRERGSRSACRAVLILSGFELTAEASVEAGAAFTSSAREADGTEKLTDLILMQRGVRATNEGVELIPVVSGSWLLDDDRHHLGRSDPIAPVRDLKLGATPTHP